jgi:DNA mismatch repair protein MutS
MVLMTFQSILFEKREDGLWPEPSEAPACFADLNLDQVVDAITSGREEYRLKPLFAIPLKEVRAVEYRQEIMRDLENPTLAGYIHTFAQQMRKMREYLALADKLYYPYQKKRWFLDAVDLYCEAVRDLLHDLSLARLQAHGLLAFRNYLEEYVSSDEFIDLVAETEQLKADLSTIAYCLLIKGGSVKVRRYASERDYSTEVEETFAKFKQGAAKDYRVKFSDWQEMNHIEAQILDLVARLYPDIFSHLDEYGTKHGNYLNKTIAVFDREIQFYLGYLEYIARLKRKGLKFCYPRVSTTCKEVYDFEGFDLALATKLANENQPVVCNDFSLEGPERAFVVTGPNQGGKTTFARTFGQVHYLASLGCPIPGREAQIFLCDQIFTHFEKEEHIENLRGKLQDDLVRIARMLSQATPNSLLILNEIFTSTTMRDAFFLSTKILEAILRLDALCVCVTFIDELSSLSEKTVSVVSTVMPDNPALRTYKIVRKPADGLVYAIALAENYRLTYDRLKERLTS